MVYRKTALFLCTCCILTAQSTLGATIQQYLPELLKSHERIKAAQSKTQAVEYIVKQYKAGYLPTLDLIAESGYENMRAAQLLYDFGGTSKQIDKSKTMLAQAGLEEEDVRQQVLLEGILACVNVIKERDRLSYAKRSENNIKTQTGIEETLVDKGAGLLELTARYRQLVPASLEDSINTALETNPGLKAKAMDRNLADDEITARKAAYYPRLELIGQGKYRYNDDGLEGTRTDFFVGLGITYNLYRGGADQAAVHAAEAERHSFVQQFEEEKDLVVEEVRNSWQTLVTAEAKREVLANQAMIAVRFLELARKEREMGNRTLLEVLSAEVEYYRAMSNAVAAQAEANGAIFSLLKAIGMLKLELLEQANPL